MKSRMPLPGVIVVLSLLWLVLLGVTIWAFMAANGKVEAPAPSLPTSVQATGTPAADGSSALTLVWNPISFNHFLVKIQWAGLALAGVIVLAVVIGAAVQEKAKRRHE